MGSPGGSRFGTQRAPAKREEPTRYSPSSSPPLLRKEPSRRPSNDTAVQRRREAPSVCNAVLDSSLLQSGSPSPPIVIMISPTERFSNRNSTSRSSPVSAPFV